MRRYETILIAHVDLSEDELSGLIARYGAIVTGQKGVMVKVERWGKRKLAYPIKRFGEGFYVLMRFKLKPALGKELETSLGITEEVLRHLLVKLEG